MVPAIRVVDTDVIGKMRQGEVALPDSDYDLVRDKPFGGSIVMEHQARPARIVNQGDIICSSTQGGGGYGDVLERAPEQVMDDLRANAISQVTAKRIFCVAFDPETLRIDVEGTEKLREEERARRRARAKPYGAFVKEWEKKRPHPQALKFFGTWPEGKPNRMVVRI